MPDYVLPQVIIFQEFTIAPTALTEPLRACIVGEQFALNRYSDPDEKDNIQVTGSYNPDVDESFLWPNRQPGAVVDETYTKVFIDNALLQYHEDPGGDGSEIRAVPGTRNRIRFEALVLQTANGFNRSAPFGDRDVSPGDVLDIVASACGEPHSLRVAILDLVADQIAAVIGDLEADPDNTPMLVETGSEVQSAGATNDVDISAVDASGYDGRDDGQPEEVYIVEVVAGGTGGLAESALLQVVAQSGKEGPFTITPAAFGAPTDIGERGATATWSNTGDNFEVGQEWTITLKQEYEEPDAVQGGIYQGAGDTTYVVEISKGGDVGTAEYKVSTSTGIDMGSAAGIPSLGVALPVGSQGLTITFVTAPNGFVNGDRFTIAVETAKDGAIKTAVLSTPLPPELRGICEVDLGGGSSSSSSGTPADLGVTFYIDADIEVPENRTGKAPLVNWEQSDTEVTLKSGIEAFDATFTIGGTLVALPVKDGDVFAEHRDRLPTWCETVGTISDVSEINDVFSTGPVIDPDNELVFGVFKALENSGGTAVKFISVCSQSPVTLNDWVEALEQLEQRDDTYSLVPLTQDKQVQDLFVAHVEAMSAPDKGRWRITWLNTLADTEIPVYAESNALGNDGGVIFATVEDDPDTSGTQFTLLTAAGEKFLTDPDTDIDPGDIVRILYEDDGFGNESFQEFVVDEILNDEEIRLFSGPDAAINTAIKMEIHRTLNRTQTANELALKPGTFSTRRAYLVWPDEIGNAGQVFPGYFACCSLAGLRSASLPHRPLTNVEILGFDDVSRTTEFFNQPQLDTLAGAGFWIITQDPNDGQIFTRHQLSTDNLDLLRREQSITTNVDSISFTFLNRMKVYIGRANVTPIMISIVEAELLSILDFFTNFVVTDIVGPQILSYEILEIGQHPLLKDRILVRIDIEVPFPFNNLELHLVV